MNNYEEENFFNPQSKAIQIENILNKQGLAMLHSADTIRKNPMAFLDTALKIYEKHSDEHEKRAADFWDKYEKFSEMSLDDIGNDTVDQMISDLRALFKW